MGIEIEISESTASEEIDLGQLRSIVKRKLKTQTLRIRKTHRRIRKAEKEKGKYLHRKHKANENYHSMKRKNHEKTAKAKKKSYKCIAGKKKAHFEGKEHDRKKSGASVQPIKLKGAKGATYKGVTKMENRWNYSDAIPTFYGRQMQSKRTGARLWKYTHPSNFFHNVANDR